TCSLASEPSSPPLPPTLFLFPGPRTPSPTQPLRRSQRKSGPDLPSTLPEIWPKASHAASVRKPIVLKKIVAHSVKVRANRRAVGWEPKWGGGWICDRLLLSPQIPPVHTPRRSPRIAFFLEKENEPPRKEPAGEELFKTSSVPATPTPTPTPTPVLCPRNVESNCGEEDLDARDLEMSKKVRRSYSRLQMLASASASTPGRRSCFGFEGLLGAEDLATVSPVRCSKLTEVPRVPVQPWAPDTTLPGISPPAMKEKRKKKKVPQILVSEGRGSSSAVTRAAPGDTRGSAPAGPGERCSGQHTPLSSLTCKPPPPPPISLPLEIRAG
uniref:Cell division cycle associated 5 n=1 Tax=Suricata suricatta TaxID=37032 RepID=A0A673UJQ1_SURSU